MCPLVITLSLCPLLITLSLCPLRITLCVLSFTLSLWHLLIIVSLCFSLHQTILISYPLVRCLRSNFRPCLCILISCLSFSQSPIYQYIFVSPLFYLCVLISSFSLYVIFFISIKKITYLFHSPSVSCQPFYLYHVISVLISSAYLYVLSLSVYLCVLSLLVYLRVFLSSFYLSVPCLSFSRCVFSLSVYPSALVLSLFLCFIEPALPNPYPFSALPSSLLPSLPSFTHSLH